MSDLFQIVIDDLNCIELEQMQFDTGAYINFNAANMGVLPKHIIDRVNYHKLQINTPNQAYRLRDDFIKLIKQKISDLYPDKTDKSLYVTYGTTLALNLICLMLKARNTRTNFITLHGEHEGLLAPFMAFTNLEVVENLEKLQEKLRTTEVDGICVSDVRYKDGVRNDLRSISDMRNRYAPDAIILADLAQSFSVADIPFEHFDIGIASAHKWMAGAGGHGFVWMNDKIKKELMPLQGTIPKNNEYGFVGGHDFKGLMETYQAIILRLKSITGYKIGIKNYVEKFNAASKLQIKTNTECFNIISVREVENAYEIYKKIIQQKLDVKFINDNDPLFRITIPYYASDFDVSRGFDILSENLR